MNTTNTSSTYCFLLENPDVQGPTYAVRPKKKLDIAAVQKRADVQLTRKDIAEILEEMGKEKRREASGD
jgi:hypothetical protein